MEVATTPNNTNTFPNSLPLHIYKSILLFIRTQKDERAKKSPRFLELLNQINEGFMPEQVKELRKRK